MKDGLNGLPVWVKAVATVGFPALITMYLLGMIPFVSSPIQELMTNQRALAEGIQRHDRTTREMLRIFRWSCRGIWKANPEAAEQCDAVEDGR